MSRSAHQSVFTFVPTGPGGFGRYVGRVGALAVALGVGAAVATGQGIGVARADDTSSSSSSSTDSAPSDTSSSSSSSTDSAPSDTSSNLPAAETSSTPAGSDTDTTGSTPHSPTVPSMNVQVSGTATVVGRDDSESDASSPAEDDEDAADTESATEPTDNTPVAPPAVFVPPAPAKSETHDEPAPAVETSPAQRDSSTSESTPAAREVATPRVTTAAVTPPATQMLRTTTAVVAPPTPAPAPALRPQDPVSALVALPGAILSAVLSPFFNPGPIAPARPPLLLAVLSLVAREIQRVLFNATPVARSQQVDITLQDPTDVSAPIAFDVHDDDGEPLVYSVPERGAAGGPKFGTVTIDQASGTFGYNPDDAMALTGGSDTFTVTVSDAAAAPHLHGLPGLVSFGTAGHTTTATVTVNVIAVNDPPVGADDHFTTAEDTPLTGNVLANDVDSDSATLTTTVSTGPTHGTLALRSDGVFTYTPSADFNGTDSFTYTVSDGFLTDTATATITVTPVNDPVVAVPDTNSTDEDTPVSGNVLTNDRAQNVDGPDEPITVAAGTFTSTQGGTVVTNANGAYTYTPKLDFNGVDTFSYTVADAGSTATGVVTITVAAVNDPIVAVPVSATTLEGNAVSGNVLPDVRAVNPDGLDEVLTVIATGAADSTRGSISFDTDGSYTYTPAPNFFGTITYSYIVTDGTSSATGVLTITVKPVDDPIAAVDDAAATDEDTPVTIDVLANDRAANPDGPDENLAVTMTTAPANGTVVVNPDGSVTYVSNANFHGTDSFTYTVSDGASTSVGTVSVTVRPVNDPVVAIDDTITTDEDTPVTGNVLTNDNAQNVDTGETLTVTAGTYTTTHGRITITADGAYTYTPAPNYHGQDTFTYTVTDGPTTATGTLTITVRSVNDPLPNVIIPITIDEDAAPQTGNLLDAIRRQNPDGPDEPVTITGVLFNPSPLGTFVVNPNGDYTFTPAPNQYGSTVYDVRVSDTQFDSLVTITVTVRPVNDPVVAIDDTITTDEDTPVTGNVLTNDNAQNVDGPMEPLIVTPGLFTTSRGSIRINSWGEYTYTPAAGFFGTDTFSYTVTDGTTTATGTLTITVVKANTPPTAPVIDAGTLTPDRITGIVRGTATATDVDGDRLVFSGSTTTAKGSVVVNANGTFTYTPNQLAREAAITQSATDSFTITVSDGKAIRSTTVTVDIARVNVVLGTVLTGDLANGIGVTPDGTRAYVANQGAGRVSVIDLATNSEITQVLVGGTPTAVAVSPDGTRAYVSNQVGFVTVIDTTSDTVLNPISTPLGALGLTVSPDGRRVYVAHTQGTGISVIDTTQNRVVDLLQVPLRSRAVATSPDGRTLYVTAYDANRLFAVNTSTGVVTTVVDIPGSGFNRIVLSPDGNRAYITHNATGLVSIVDLQARTLITSVTVPNSPNVLALSPDGTRLYVTGVGAGVTVIDAATNSVLGTITVGGNSRGVTVSADGTKLYVTSDLTLGGGSATTKVTIIAIGNLGAPPIGV